MTITAQHPADEKAALIKDIRVRLPFLAIGHPDLAESIAVAMDAVETEQQRPKILATEMAEMASYLWGLVLMHHGPDHRGSAGRCDLSFCSTIRYAVVRLSDALIEAGHPDPMVEDFKPEHRPARE